MAGVIWPQESAMVVSLVTCRLSIAGQPPTGGGDTKNPAGWL
jgi:hypothetical protein